MAQGSRDECTPWSAARDQRARTPAYARYVSPEMTGAQDLDAYGDWSETPEYGAVWVPRDIAADWAPYRTGHWAWKKPDGSLTELRGDVRFDHVATRRAGQRDYVSLHMHLPAHWTLARAAALCGEVERALLAAVPAAACSIQMLPDGDEPLALRGKGEESCKS